MIKFIIVFLIAMSQIKDNTIISYDYDSIPIKVPLLIDSPMSFAWNGTMNDFINIVPLKFKEFITTEEENLDYNIKVLYNGPLKQNLKLLYVYVISESYLKLELSIKKENAIYIKVVDQKILAEKSTVPLESSLLTEDNIHYAKNVPLVYLINQINSYNNCQIGIEEELFDKNINLSFTMPKDKSFLELSSSLERLGLSVTIKNEKSYLKVVRI